MAKIFTATYKNIPIHTVHAKGEFVLIYIVNIFRKYNCRALKALQMINWGWTQKLYSKYFFFVLFNVAWFELIAPKFMGISTFIFFCSLFKGCKFGDNQTTPTISENKLIKLNLDHQESKSIDLVEHAWIFLLEKCVP